MSISKIWSSFAVTLACIAATGSAARAAFIVTMQQVGSDVVATGSGTINTSALTVDQYAASEPALVWPSAGMETVGPTDSPTVDVDSGITGPSTFGSGGGILATTGSGNPVGVVGMGNGVYFDVLYLPGGYNSGSALSDTATYSGATFSSLGITPGSYTWTWGNGGTADSFTLDVVPEPSACILIGITSAALLLRRRRAGRAS